MENNKCSGKDDCGCGCSKMGAGMCGGKSACGCGHDHAHVMKWLVKIALLVIVFSFAFKMGELKGMLENRGFMMRGYQPVGMMYRYGTDYTGSTQGGAGLEDGTTAPVAPSAPAVPTK